MSGLNLNYDLVFGKERKEVELSSSLEKVDC